MTETLSGPVRTPTTQHSDASRSDVLREAIQLRGTGDRNDPRLLSQQPGQCNVARLLHDALWTPRLERILRPGVVASLTTRSATLLRDTVSEPFLNSSPFCVVA